MKTKRTYEDLRGVEKECFDLLHSNQGVVDENTDWCLSFWGYKQAICGGLMGAIRKYKPESLTKYRRNLIFDGLIFPSEKSKEHSAKMEQQNHKPEYLHNQEADWKQTFQRTNQLN